jgi:hypothetical protein
MKLTEGEGKITKLTFPAPTSEAKLSYPFTFSKAE